MPGTPNTGLPAKPNRTDGTVHLPPSVWHTDGGVVSTHGCTCWEPGVVEDADCPRHGIVPFIDRLADARQAAVDEEVDRWSDAAADRADTTGDER